MPDLGNGEWLLEGLDDYREYLERMRNYADQMDEQFEARGIIYAGAYCVEGLVERIEYLDQWIKDNVAQGEDA